MADYREEHHRRGGRVVPWRIVGWGGVAFLLLLPLVTGAPWTLSDFIAAGAMLGGAGLLVELAVRASLDPAYRAGAGLAVAAIFLLIWVNGAVGFLGDEDNPANLVFIGVIAIAALGALLAGFQPLGMARAMFAAAAAQVAVGIAALAAGWGSPGYAGVYEIVLGTSLFTLLWLTSATLFLKAARDQRHGPRASG